MPRSTSVSECFPAAPRRRVSLVGGLQLGRANPHDPGALERASGRGLGGGGRRGRPGGRLADGELGVEEVPPRRSCRAPRRSGAARHPDGRRGQSRARTESRSGQKMGGVFIPGRGRCPDPCERGLPRAAPGRSWRRLPGRGRPPSRSGSPCSSATSSTPLARCWTSSSSPRQRSRKPTWKGCRRA